MKKIFLIIMLTTSAGTMAFFDNDKVNKSKEVTEKKTAKDCEIPAFAKAIGHEDKWLLHNGCPPREKAKQEKSK